MFLFISIISKIIGRGKWGRFTQLLLVGLKTSKTNILFKRIYIKSLLILSTLSLYKQNFCNFSLLATKLIFPREVKNVKVPHRWGSFMHNFKSKF